MDRNVTQQELAERAGMSLSSLRRFERTGEIAFLSLVRVAMALDATTGLAGLFPAQVRTLDDVLDRPRRQRGRRS
ncbi:MAG: helix-turn-helix transcriptional regulator [Myxococcota bacterium]